MSALRTIKLEETERGWVATDTQRDVSSAVCPTREEALADLDENVALAADEIELSESAREAIRDTEGEYERGDTVGLDDLERERDSDE